MLSRIVARSLTRRWRRKALSVLAVTLGVAVATAVGTIALEVGDRVNGELRAFGANLSVTPAADSVAVNVGGVDYRPAGEGAYLAESDLLQLKRIFWRHNIMAFAPLLYLPASVEGLRVVLIGSWFDKELKVDRSERFRTGLEALHPAWKVTGQWPADGDASGCLVGARLAAALNVRPGRRMNLVTALSPSGEGDRSIQSRPAGSAAYAPEATAAWAELVVRGILETGGPEDDQVLAPLETVQRLAGLEGKVRRVEVSALTKPEDSFARSDLAKLSPEEFDRWFCSPYVSSIAYQIQQAIPGAEARPVYRVAETEGRILNRIGVLMGLLAGAALATAALAVASMMLASVLEQRVEIGLFKSLGATNAGVAMGFLMEALIVGVLGGMAGYVTGSLLARRLSLAVFGVPTSFHGVILPAAVGLALLDTLVGSGLPLARGLRVSPARVLRYE